MSSKRRLRRASCGDKRRYDHDGAHYTAFRMRRQGQKVQAYKCKWCPAYHVGHAKG